MSHATASTAGGKAAQANGVWMAGLGVLLVVAVSLCRGWSGAVRSRIPVVWHVGLLPGAHAAVDEQHLPVNVLGEVAG